MLKKIKIDSTLLIPPKELLENAKELIESGNRLFFRAAILESIIALEVFINELVFKYIEKNYSKNIATNIKNITKFRSEERLNWVLELATGKTLKDENNLWQNYRSIKKIRNEITHLGRKVELKEADNAYNNVNSILGFLLINIEIPNFIKEFGDSINIHNKSYISIEREILKFLRTKFDPFLNRKFKKVQSQNQNKSIFDLYYKAGDYEFVVELKAFRKCIEKSRFLEMIERFEESLQHLKLDKIFVVVLVKKNYKIPYLDYKEKIEFIFLSIL